MSTYLIYPFQHPLSLSPLSFFHKAPSRSNNIIPILNFIVQTFLLITNQPLLLFTSFSMSPLLTVPSQPELPSFSSNNYTVVLSPSASPHFSFLMHPSNRSFSTLPPGFSVQGTEGTLAEVTIPVSVCYTDVRAALA